MTFYIGNEKNKEFPFDEEEVAKKVIAEALSYENCPYDACVELDITDDEGIQALNKEFRGIDAPTDVLSFPNVDYSAPADFSQLEESAENYFDLESGELCLGDIVVNADRVYSQAREYGHSELREYAFLIAHSMLHLMGYDHMDADEAGVMEEKQEEILQRLNITREQCK